MDQGLRMDPADNFDGNGKLGNEPLEVKIRDHLSEAYSDHTVMNNFIYSLYGILMISTLHVLQSFQSLTNAYREHPAQINETKQLPHPDGTVRM